MSRRPIALSADLLRLQNEGYELEIVNGHLLIKQIPYVDHNKAIRRGILLSKLKLAGDRTEKPDHHVAYWIGDHPCHSTGEKIRAFENFSTPPAIAENLQPDFIFSAKADYRDYHHKMTCYISRIAGEATKLDPDVDARIFPAIPEDDENAPFAYVDTASSRSGISAVNNRVTGQKIGIAGLGGTGAYVLDLLAKTPVAEIHVFDGDVFSQHNAFRAPGAPSLCELQARPKKVARFGSIYSNMHNGIVAHDEFLEKGNLNLLDGLDFVFICLDQGAIKRLVTEYLVANGIPFVEVGLGVSIVEGKLAGIVRVTTSTPQTRDLADPYISYTVDVGQINEYATNVQIAELNALNAAMAVIQWKRLNGIYPDTRQSYYQGYSLPSGEIVSESKE